MREKHHDAELSLRLAEKVMDWKIVGDYWVTNEEDDYVLVDGSTFPWGAWDPCCNGYHSWLLEERVAKMGYDVTSHSSGCPDDHDTAIVVPCHLPIDDHGGWIVGETAIHAKALAIDGAVNQ